MAESISKEVRCGRNNEFIEAAERFVLTMSHNIEETAERYLDAWKEERKEAWPRDVVVV
jgi:hypothetical protein